MAPYAKREYYSKFIKRYLKIFLNLKFIIVHNKRPKDLYQYSENLNLKDLTTSWFLILFREMIIELVNKISKNIKLNLFFLVGEFHEYQNV